MIAIPPVIRKLYHAILFRLRLLCQETVDAVRVFAINLVNQWPCENRKYLLVGSESSGTTAVSNLLFRGNRSLRFLEEGDHQWVWDVYKEVFQAKRRIQEYPRLQLFDAIKVPGFATIIAQFRDAFPRSKVIYLLRDPRDVVNSAIKTWKLQSVEDLATISWSKETWLSIPNQDPVERLAIRWRTYLRSAMKQDDIIFLRYEDFCADKLGVIADLSNRVGLPFDEPRVRKLANVQLSDDSVRNYRPKGPGRWKTGILAPSDIAKIESLCEEEMTYWNYELEYVSRRNGGGP